MCIRDRNYVNATFNCLAVLKDEDGAERESYLTAITSTYQLSLIHI